MEGDRVPRRDSGKMQDSHLCHKNGEEERGRKEITIVQSTKVIKTEVL